MMGPSAERRSLYMAIGRELKTRREAAGITLRAFAEQIGTTSSTIAKIESAETACPVYMLVAAADVFDCTLDSLVPVLTEKERVS